MHQYYTYYQSPIGKLRLRANDEGLLAVDHTCQQEHHDPHWVHDKHQSILQRAITELNEYFEKSRITFTIPLEPQGTPFQQQVWQQLQTIPYGQTYSYSDIASAINQPRAVRAVGAANGRNPLSIFIPCHRVIGKNGKLTGYAGGMQTKKFLLDFEISRTY